MTPIKLRPMRVVRNPECQPDTAVIVGDLVVHPSDPRSDEEILQQAHEDSAWFGQVLLEVRDLLLERKRADAGQCQACGRSLGTCIHTVRTVEVTDFTGGRYLDAVGTGQGKATVERR